MTKVERVTPISEFRTTTVSELYISHENRSFKVDRLEADKMFGEVVIALNAAYAAKLQAKYAEFVGGSNA